MKKQRICIVGDGLSGLMTALTLNKLEGFCYRFENMPGNSLLSEQAVRQIFKQAATKVREATKK